MAIAARTLRGSRGWTLTELLMVVSLIGILTVMGNQLFIQISRFFRLNQARIDIQRDARAVFNVIGRNVRQGVSTTVVIDSCSSTSNPVCTLPPVLGSGGAQTTPVVTTAQPPYSRLTFQKVTGPVYSYYQSGTWLVQQVTVGTVTQTEVLSKNLLYVAFSHPRTDDDSIISISLTMQEATYEGGSKALQLSVEQIHIMN